MKDLLFSRTLKDKCPICNEKIDKDYKIVNYDKAKLKVCNKHIKYKEE